MRVLMLGVNHRTAAVDLREKLALAGASLDAAIGQARARFPAAEWVVLSTCNRTEFYFARPSHEPPSVEELRAFIAGLCQVSEPDLLAATIHRENEQAVAHLFRVASGLESMVLGEPQILGQVKRAYETANSGGAVGPVLHRVFQQAIAVAKHVRTETGIDAGRLSVGSVAVDFARRIFDTFDDKVVVGIGAGEMAKLTLRHLASLRPAKLWLTNRTSERANALAQRLGIATPSGGVRPFEALDELLVEADIVLTSTGATEPIITAARFKKLLKKRRSRPLFIVDIAVPRDVEAAVGSLTNVYLYNIDDLQRVVEQTHAGRTEEVARCEQMLQTAVATCLAEIQHRDVGELVRALRSKLMEIGEGEKDRTRRRLGPVRPEDRAAFEEALEEHTHRVINKILHLPLSQLDRRKADAPLAFYAAALRRLFGLGEGESSVAPQPPEAPEVPEASESGTTDAHGYTQIRKSFDAEVAKSTKDQESGLA